MKYTGNNRCFNHLVQFKKAGESPYTAIKFKKGKNQYTKNSIDWYETLPGIKIYPWNHRKTAVKTQP
jgi:hypothetical protein